MTDLTDDHKHEIYTKFKHDVNMTPREIEAFLKTKESKGVGQVKSGEKESIGHQSGKRIIEILCKYQTKLTDDDYHHMAHVSSYIARHLAQGGPEHDKEHSRWRYSLMNWGCDPCK